MFTTTPLLFCLAAHLGLGEVSCDRYPGLIRFSLTQVLGSDFRVEPLHC